MDWQLLRISRREGAGVGGGGVVVVGVGRGEEEEEDVVFAKSASCGAGAWLSLSSSLDLSTIDDFDPPLQSKTWVIRKHGIDKWYTQCHSLVCAPKQSHGNQFWFRPK